MKKTETEIVRVAIDVPVRKLFDYLPPENFTRSNLRPGVRVIVPFGRKKNSIGLIIETSDFASVEKAKLKRVIKFIDTEPLVDQNLLRFYTWAAEYYHHAIGEVIMGALPARLKKDLPVSVKEVYKWHVNEISAKRLAELDNKAPKQAALFRFIQNQQDGANQATLREQFVNINPLLKAMEKKGLLTRTNVTYKTSRKNYKTQEITLRSEQQHAVDLFTSSLEKPDVYTLNGITGSGKTEVYIQCIKKVIETGKQALILVPEIGLTPQLIARFNSQLNTDIAVIHSAISDQERMKTWLKCQGGSTSILIGTRSAIWTPFKNIGIVIVDEEHDLSYKQQDGFRYSARDLAIVRAKFERVPVILGSATPSLETLHNINTGRYIESRLGQRNDNSLLPEIQILDIRNQPMEGAISITLLKAIREHIQKKQQVLLFLNRRGYAPVILCHACGWTHRCPRCDIQMTYHKAIDKQICHHCQHQEKAVTQCPECGSNKIIQVGSGTQRLTENLEQLLPGVNILRIDRDSTRRKGIFQEMIDDINQGQVDILVGTQMVTKGHHFPNLTLVGIVDVDRGLCSNDFRASERMGQLILQVSGRAGRANKPGKVILQTHFPDHPLLQKLTEQDYSGFSTMLLGERKQASLPPYCYQILIRADATHPEKIFSFLRRAKNLLEQKRKNIEIFGPYAAPIEKRAGRYRAQLLLQTDRRSNFQKQIPEWLENLQGLPDSRTIRWSIDVDPQELL